ncbi:MAG: hypothetical protein JXA00_06640, partial [Candidatus Thermoplasmatota archaeon]|nr:hypothetical protein [Candidatus Thermoplasmatota archaeon]
FANELTGHYFVYDEMGRAHGRERWGPVQGLEFYIDDVLINETNPTETTTEYLWNVEGQSLGEHIFQAAAIDENGCRHYSWEVPITVTQTRPRLRIEHDIDRVGTYFHLYVYLRSNGQEDAYLDVLTVNLTGYQPVWKTTADYTLQSYYDPVVRKCRTQITFSPGFTLAPFDVYTVDFLAVPIMHDGLDFNNIDIMIDYHSVDNDTFSEAYSELESWEYLRGEAHEAFDESDYLIVANPTNLLAIFNTDDVNLLLSKAAELATLKDGVLGYYTGYASLQTQYDSTDYIAAGNVRDDYHDEVIVADEEEDRIRVYDVRQRENSLRHTDLPSGSKVAVGNTLTSDWHSGVVHGWEEIMVAEPTGPNASRVTLYQLNASEPWWFVNIGDFNTHFSTGDGFAVGDVLGYGYDQILVANCDSGDVEIHDPLTPTPLQTISTVFEEGDFFLVGDIDMWPNIEFLVGHVADQRFYKYDQYGFICSTPSLIPFVSSDSMALGDVTGDSTEEIIIGDASYDEVVVYDFSSVDHLDLVSRGSLSSLDEVIAGNLLADGKEEIIVARGQYTDYRYKGEMELIEYSGLYRYEDRLALDDLLNTGGGWANKMNSTWTSDGYLLLIGEDESIPAFSCEEDDKHIRSTDRYYASTGGSSRHPELGTGRIIGDNPLRMIKPIQVSIDLARGTSTLDLTRALVVAGYSSGYSGGSASIDFVGERNSVADKLRDIGFSNVEEAVDYATSRPSGMTEGEHIQSRRDYFFGLADNRDLIHLPGHGGWSNWDLILGYNVSVNFSSGAARPVVVATSCNTGRYAEGMCFAECFLDKNASAYIGATEVSYCCMNTDLANRFYNRLLPGKYLGLTLKETLSSHVSGGPWYERDIRRYNGALYHLYGDPKLIFTDADAHSDTYDDSPVVEKRDEEVLQLTLPNCVITQGNATDYVTIPGGGLIVVPGMPLVPSYTLEVEYPVGRHIQDVQCVNQGSLTMFDSLHLSTAVIAEAGSNPTARTLQNNASGLWPDRVYDWEVIWQPNGSSLLYLTVYPFYYNNLTLQGSYYQDYTFLVNITAPVVRITALRIEKTCYSPGENVSADVYLELLDGEPQDVILDAQILSENTEEVIDGLALRLLHDLRGFASVHCEWNSTGFESGNYLMRIAVSDHEGRLMDTDLVMYTLGITAGVISNFTATPQYFDVGDQITINTTVLNTGTQPLNGTLSITIVNTTTSYYQEIQQDIAEVLPDEDITLTTAWNTTGIAEGEYRIAAVFLYEGGYTDVPTRVVSTGVPVNQAPITTGVSPSPGATGVSRPPSSLSVTVDDPEDDPIDLAIRWRNHTGGWVTLTSESGVGDGTYEYVPSGNNWIWGNTTYTWSINVTDGYSWVNQTYTFTTMGSRYDV